MPRRAWVRLLVAGAASGLLFLGIGGRLAMASIHVLTTNSPPQWSVGGTVTVVALGVASGLAGALMAIVARWTAGTLRRPWLEYLMLSAMLAFITARGLHGTAPVGRWFFVPLVFGYAVSMLWLDRTLQRRA